MTTHMLKSAAAAICALIMLHGSANAEASTDKLRAEAYFNAIAGGDAETITSFYAEKAEFHWVGGPLAGVYSGTTQIKAVWTRFVAAAGKVDYKVLDLSESRNGKIATVTARVDFIGPTQLPVKFILMYENGKIIKEIWQVEKPTTFAGADPAPTPATEPAAAQAPAIAATITERPVAPPPAAKSAPATERTAAPAPTVVAERPAAPAPIVKETEQPSAEKAPAAPAANEPPTPAADAPTATAEAQQETPPLPEKLAAARAEAAEDREGAPPVSINTVSVDPVAPPARKAAAPNPPHKPKAKVAKKVEKKTFSEYEDEEDDEDYYAYEPGYRYGYGYRRPLRFRFGYGYYND